jgi:DNA-binding NarL/FixJ family response regulator
MNCKIRLLIADNHMLAAESYRHMLGPELEVVGIITDGRALIRAALEFKPDVAILELSLPHLNGLDAAEQIKHKLPYVKLIFATANLDPEIAAEAFQRGTSGYVPKQSRAEELVTAIRRVTRGESYLSPLVAREAIHYLLRQPDHKLSERRITMGQAEILQLLAEGKMMKEVAGILAISPRTVALHKYRMMARLGIETTAGLPQYAMGNQTILASENWTVTDGRRAKSVDARTA